MAPPRRHGLEGSNVFHTQTGYSNNVSLEYILSGGSGNHWYCGEGQYPSKAPVIYAGW